MSAYVVPDEHIFFLVNAAKALKVTRVYNGDTEAFDLRGLFCDGRDEDGQTLAGRLASILYAENVASVNYRYDEADDALPFDDVPMCSWGLIEGNPIDVLDAVRGYAHQANEHPGWKSSDAHAFCEVLQDHAIDALPRPDGVRCWEIGAEEAKRYQMRGGAFAGL